MNGYITGYWFNDIDIGLMIFNNGIYWWFISNYF